MIGRMRKLAIGILVGALGWLLAAPAAAQPSPLADPRIAPVRQRIERSIAAANADGLPSEWLVDKVAEGLSKRAPADRIAAAVEALLARLRTAESLRSAIRESAQDEERRAALRAIADALAVGAPAGQLVALIGQVTSTPARDIDAHERVRLAMRTVAELGERGFAGDVAARVTLRAFRSGGIRGWDILLDSARSIPSGSDVARAAALEQLAESVRAVRGRRPDHSVDRGAPPRDDSHGRGRRTRTRRRGGD
jgi:hypothetical protein